MSAYQPVCWLVSFCAFDLICRLVWHLLAPALLFTPWDSLDTYTCSVLLTSHGLLCCVLPAGTASSAESLAVQRMVPDSRMREYAASDPLPPQSRARMQAGDQGQCHDFTADAVLGRTSEVYDINGILSLLCRYVLIKPLQEACYDASCVLRQLA